ncbi:uncharacterized protein N7482_000899 [Penicillium canariense]|uniref:Uncharacterized protein n=1 Tax=Penicillium canariense TaxID=189055 RepID=A0A9W9LTK7_9EURO|nr:uncharacterized protein N7482_000899 [Penicillium canariense]KAJ5175022.1 hypothetical protein N7482_000899 [Penicillium canariense]
MRQSENRHQLPDPPAPMQGQRSVFRIPNYKSQTALLHGSTAQPAERAYHSRRAHRKSRGGCANCKQRRVKGVAQFMSRESLSSSMSLLLVADKIDELLQLGSAASGLKSKSRLGLPSTGRVLEALRHFNLATVASYPAQKNPSNMDMMRMKMTQLAFETPFLMHAIIGIAITHLCNVVPDNSHYRIAEAFHWGQAVHQYSGEVSTGVDGNNMDKLYSTCILLTVHSFLLEEFNPRTSFVFSNDPSSLNWLRLQAGLRYLLEHTAPWMSESMWWATFMESHDPRIDSEDRRPGRVGLDPDFADLCGIDEMSTVDNNPLLWPLRMLTWLLVLEISPKSAQKYNMWMGRLEPAYYDCLLAKNPPALVLLAWWLALICHVDEWWMETRARSECTAICMRLEDTDDPLVLKLLEFPAQSCGYLLRHVQERTALERPGDILLVC